MPQLSEHDQPVLEQSQTQKQSNEDRQDVKMVLNLYSQGKKARSKFDADWKKREEFYQDKQWQVNQNTDRSKPTMNVIYTTVQTKLPLLTDSKPGLNVIPPEPQDFEFATMMGEAVDSWWEKGESAMDHTLDEILLDSMVKDAGIAKITWDVDKEEGAGDARIDRIDPKDIYIPYGARDFDKNCPWVIHEMRKPVGELKRKFPKMAAFIKTDDDGDDEKTEGVSTDVTLVSPTDQRSEADGNTSSSGGDDRKTATVLECWMDDNSVEEYIEENEEGKVKKAKKKYPDGRLVTILKNGKIKLHGDKHPYKHGKKPFVRFIDQIRAGEFWGDGEARPLMNIQRAINRILQNALDYSGKMGNPVWFTEAGNGVDPEMITNATGQVIQVGEGKLGTIRRDIPQPMGQEVRQLYDLLVRASEVVSGSSDVTQGRKPVGVTAASAIENLQEASHTRIRKQERNMNVSLGQMGFQLVSLMMQFYRQHRVAKITGKKGWPEFFEFFLEETPEGISASRKKHRFLKEEKRFVGEDQFTQLPATKGVFDVKVMSGTSLPFAKAQRANLSMKLFELGLIDQEEVLNSVDWPNTEEVLARMKEQQQAQAEAQAQLPGGQ